jgi:hypothetical protein
MKTGMSLVVTAVTLFAGTVIWSSMKPIAQKKFSMTELDINAMEEHAADRKSNNSWYFQSEAAMFYEVSAPVQVEIDESFFGVELLGDTSLFQYLIVDVNNDKNIRRSIEVRERTSAVVAGDTVKTAENISQLLQSANITVRLGVGSGKDFFDRKDSRPRTIRLTSCRNVRSATPITGKRVLVESEGIDSMFLNVDTQLFSLVTDAGQKKSRQYVQLTGATGRAHYMLKETTLEADHFYSKESYLDRCSNAGIRIFAAEIVNSRRTPGCKIDISGNPVYQRFVED